ncbi:glutamate receptor ionotropic, kainate 2-like, partial [Teleopsis dalmanni]
MLSTCAGVPFVSGESIYRFKYFSVWTVKKARNKMRKPLKIKFLVTYLFSLIFSGAVKVTMAYSQLDSYNFESNQGTSSSIRIGLISDFNTEHLRTAFEFGIFKANSDLSVPLVGITEEINYGNSLQANDKLCQLMKDSIGGVFAPTAKHTAAHLMQICDDKDVPYIYPRMTDKYDGFNLFPHPIDVATALHSIISAFEWSRFIFLYESSNYHTILDGLMSFYSSNGPAISVVRYDLNLNGNYKPVLRRVRKSVDNRIVVVGSTPSVAELLKQAQQVGMINEDYKYIIGNLDFQTFDLEEFKYSEVNITGFRMFSIDNPQIRELMDRLNEDKLAMQYGKPKEKTNEEGSCPITIDMALTYDAIQVFAETTKHLIYNPQPLNCSDTNDNVQNDGSTFGNYMKSLDISDKTITGRIYFEGNIRKGYTFDVIELQQSGIVKIGTWNEYTNLTIERPPLKNLVSQTIDDSLVNKTFVVLISVETKPYASLVKTHKKLVGNDQYEGYGVDLITELADRLGFNFTLVPGGNDYGTFNKTTNETSGMLKKIVEG